ncbi:ATP-binding protein [Streptomyces physcomitrii]|uniref:ATP-binding protein n=1 Tax=Streptomyces physcomitrii TaxID=2724184 RepID=UPI003F4CB932
MLMNIPDKANIFVGRRPELARVATALATSRLLTLTGTAGVGKSRLALRALASEEDRGGRDVHWVQLRSLRDDALLADAVADALGLADHTARTALEAVCGFIGERPLILVLDSCEHLVPGCRALLARLLAACPRLTAVATSREVLRLPEEEVLRVEPLAPARAGLALFTHRAADAGVLVHDAEDQKRARRLCERLDGVPLAIELAAAQLRTASLVELVDRVRSGLDMGRPAGAGADVSGPGPEPGPDALREAIDWSHELCDKAERLAWARLSVIRGSFGPELAHATAGGAPPLEQPAEVDKALTGLVQRSVLTEEDGRYRMLDAIRDYGHERLTESGEEHAAADRHARFLSRLAAQAHREWLGPHQAAWYAQVGKGYAETAAAADHLLATDPGAALQLLADIGFFWICNGHLHEIEHYVDRAVAAAPAFGPARVRGLWLLALCHLLRGEHDKGLAVAGRCRAAAVEEGTGELLQQAAYAEGLGELLKGRPQSALAIADAGLRGSAVPGEDARFDRGTVLCRLIRIFALTGSGDLARARGEAQDLRDLCLGHGEHWTRSYADYQLALIALLDGRAQDAVEHARAVLDAKCRIGDSFGIAMGLDLAAVAWAHQGQARHAALAYGAGHTYWQLVGHPQRGTPEVAPLREESERMARAALGDEAYEEAFRRAAEGDPASLAEWAAYGLPVPHV